VCVHIHVYIQAAACQGALRQPLLTHLHYSAPYNKSMEINTICYKTDDEIDKVAAAITKRASLLVHHMSGAASAKKRFGAMLGMSV
jgi:hypothetical protein